MVEEVQVLVVGWLVREAVLRIRWQFAEATISRKIVCDLESRF